MTQPASVTGKANVLASINDWLTTNVPAAGWTYNFDFALDPAVMPRVDVSEFNFFDPGDTAIGGVIFPANPLGVTEGKINRLMLQLEIRADGSQQTNALQLVRQLRDQFVYALINAGVGRDNAPPNSAPIMPPIIVKDGSGTSTNTAVRVQTEADNHLLENFHVPKPPETLIFYYQLLFKMEWFELR